MGLFTAHRRWKPSGRGERVRPRASYFRGRPRSSSPTGNGSCRQRKTLSISESRLEILGLKCGAVLFQLPARFKADTQRLADFLAMLSKRRRYAFEFRDKSWYSDEVFELLQKH